MYINLLQICFTIVILLINISFLIKCLCMSLRLWIGALSSVKVIWWQNVAFLYDSHAVINESYVNITRIIIVILISSGCHKMKRKPQAAITLISLCRYDMCNISNVLSKGDLKFTICFLLRSLMKLWTMSQLNENDFQWHNSIDFK